MARLISPVLSLSLILICLTFTNLDSHAQGDMDAWIFSTTINPDVTPLEVSGGGVFPGLDTFIVLNQEDLGNLHVYNINRGARSLESSSTIPVDTPAFGLSHKIRSANDTAHSCFVDGSLPQNQLYAVHSQNGVNWDKVLVSNQFTNFSSCDTAVDNGNVYVGACNFDLFAYGIFESTDNGQTWNLIKTIPNVRCAFSGGTRANFNMVNGVPVVFYMTGSQNGVDTITSDFQKLATSDLLATTRLETDDELVVETGDEKEVVDTDSQGPPLAESYPGGDVGGVTVIPYYHRESNTVKIAVIDPDSPIGAEVIVLDSAPDFGVFFGITCSEGPDDVVNIIYPGRHFQYDTVTGEVTEVEVTPFGDITDGPVGSSSNTDVLPPPMDDTGVLFSIFSQGNSADYAQFGRVNRNVPTIGEWGLIALAGVFMLLGVVYMRRRARA